MEAYEHLFIAILYAIAAGLVYLGIIQQDAIVGISGFLIFVIALVCTWIQLTDGDSHYGL